MLLGIDIGTSKVAIAVVDLESLRPKLARSQPTDAAFETKLGWAEQRVEAIVSTVMELVAGLPLELRHEIRAIGLTGQMHGVMLWNSDKGETSSLITWQDGRCREEGFLQSLEKSSLAVSNLKSGFGCATLAWLHRYAQRAISTYNRAATVHDYMAWTLGGGDGAVFTDPTDAASWGLFEINRSEWLAIEIEALGIPMALMPTVVPSGSEVGKLSRNWATKLGLRPGIPIGAPIGDNQASLNATIGNIDSEVALTLGTGGQVAIVLRSPRALPADLPVTMEIRPYFNGSILAVGASLSGGSAWGILPDTILRICTELQITSPIREELYSIIDRAGLATSESTLSIEPNFDGERHDPSLRGSISGIDMNNFGLGELATALSIGIATNLYSMLPPSFYAGRNAVIGSGNAIRRSAVMRRSIERVFGMPLRLTDCIEEAAQGAARIVTRLAA